MNYEYMIKKKNTKMFRSIINQFKNPEHSLKKRVAACLMLLIIQDPPEFLRRKSQQTIPPPPFVRRID